MQPEVESIMTPKMKEARELALQIIRALDSQAEDSRLYLGNLEGVSRMCALALSAAENRMLERAIAAIPEVGNTYPHGYEEFESAPSYRESVITALEVLRK